MPIKKNPDKGTARSSFLAAASRTGAFFIFACAQAMSAGPPAFAASAGICALLPATPVGRKLADRAGRGRRGGRPGGGGRGDSGQVQHPGSNQAMPTRAKVAREKEAAAGLAPACHRRGACDGDQRQAQTRRPRLHQHLRRRRRGPTTTTCAFSIGPGSPGLGSAPAARAVMVVFATKKAPLLATAMPPSRAPRTRRRSITRIALISSTWHQQRACRPPSRGRPGQGVSETPCRVHA